MSSSNGVVRIGRKGRKKFAFGEDGVPGSEPFEIDVVNVFHQWLTIEDDFRSQYEQGDDGNRTIPQRDMQTFHELLVNFVEGLRVKGTFGDGATPTGYEPVSTGEAADFLARLREQYDELVVFMRPKSREKQDSPVTSEAASELQFSEEPAN